MIKTTQTSSQAGFGMPMSWSYAAVSAASVHAFPTVGGVSVVAVAAGTERGLTNVAPVCADTRIADVVVLEDAFPGTSAWSPPT
ncbi:MAG TPA: hypothetical protein VFZ64_07450 [Nocardioidaceae bacterium]